MEVLALCLEARIFEPGHALRQDRVHIFYEHQLLGAVHSHQLIGIDEFPLRRRPCIGLGDGPAGGRSPLPRTGPECRGHGRAQIPDRGDATQLREVIGGQTVMTSKILDHTRVADEGFPAIAIDALELTKVVSVC